MPFPVKIQDFRNMLDVREFEILEAMRGVRDKLISSSECLPNKATSDDFEDARKDALAEARIFWQGYQRLAVMRILADLTDGPHVHLTVEDMMHLYTAPDDASDKLLREIHKVKLAPAKSRQPPVVIYGLGQDEIAAVAQNLHWRQLKNHPHAKWEYNGRPVLVAIDSQALHGLGKGSIIFTTEQIAATNALIHGAKSAGAEVAAVSI
jgi:hypothetical protein